MNDNSMQTTSKTVTDTIRGEHIHTIVGYSLIKGIGDGEPVASERFSVGGHEWVLLFYPDGKRSSTELAQHAHQAQLVPQATGGFPGHELMLMEQHGPAAAEGNQTNNPATNILLEQRRLHRDFRSNALSEENEYAALFVALIGEGSSPQGVLNTSEGKVVRAFHKFTLVNQTGLEEHFTKGRAREAGAVKISCARQDPNARNCHGYRKFIRRAILEDPAKGFLVDDTLVIKYSIELVVTSGGALNKCMNPSSTVRTELIPIPEPRLGDDLVDLFLSGKGSDVQLVAEDEAFDVHKIILETRSPYFKALLNSSFKEGNESIIHIKEIKAPVLKVLLHFTYSDALPDDLDANLDCSFAQHLLEAADRFEMNRLRKICERRLCSTVSVENVATTLTLAEQNRATDLKKVCLDFVSRNLQQVVGTEGYQHMLQSCPDLQTDIIETVASLSESKTVRQYHVRLPNRESNEEAGRRVRQRRLE